MRFYNLLVLVCLVVTAIGGLLGLRIFLANEEKSGEIKVEYVNGVSVNYKDDLPPEVISERNVAAAWAAQRPKKGGQ